MYHITRGIRQFATLKNALKIQAEKPHYIFPVFTSAFFDELQK